MSVERTGALPRKVLSREIQSEEGTQKDEYQKSLVEMQEKMDAHITHFFPREARHFKRPSTERMFTSFAEVLGTGLLRQMKEVVHLSRNRTFADFPREKMRALMAASIIRYVDDFIDEALWPHIHEYPKPRIKALLKTFLETAHGVAKQYDPDMPRRIIELPLIELDLALDGSQENFDNNVVALLKRKSVDLDYVSAVLKEHPVDSEMTDIAHLIICIHDIARDFERSDYAHARDFNVRNHIVNNNLDPRVLVEFVHSVRDGILIDMHRPRPQYGESDLKTCENLIIELHSLRIASIGRSLRKHSSRKRVKRRT
jgi:hypothetical protein